MIWLTSTGSQAAAAVIGLFVLLVLRFIQKSTDPEAYLGGPVCSTLYRPELLQPQA